MSAIHGTGSFTQSGGTNTQQLCSISAKLRRQRDVQSQRQRPVVGRQRIRRLTARPRLVPADRRHEHDPLLSIGSGGSYLLAGGALQVNGGLVNQGIFSGGSTPATLTANGILDLSSGTWQNLGSISLSMGANSLLIVPAGFNTSTGFASYSSLGLTHTPGTTLMVPAGQASAVRARSAIRSFARERLPRLPAGPINSTGA